MSIDIQNQNDSIPRVNFTVNTLCQKHFKANLLDKAHPIKYNKI